MTDQLKTAEKTDSVITTPGPTESRNPGMSADKHRGTSNAPVFRFGEGKADPASGLHRNGVGMLESSVIGSCRFLR